MQNDTRLTDHLSSMYLLHLHFWTSDPQIPTYV